MVMVMLMLPFTDGHRDLSHDFAATPCASTQLDASGSTPAQIVPVAIATVATRLLRRDMNKTQRPSFQRCRAGCNSRT